MLSESEERVIGNGRLSQHSPSRRRLEKVQDRKKEDEAANHRYFATRRSSVRPSVRPSEMDVGVMGKRRLSLPPSLRYWTKRALNNSIADGGNATEAETEREGGREGGESILPSGKLRLEIGD